MILPLFDQTRKNERSSYGESVRLSNELRAVPSYEKTVFDTDIQGGGVKTITIPAKWGFNCETADYKDFNTWLNSTVKKSASLFWFVIRIMAWRFPQKHAEMRTNLAERRKLEFDLILSQMKREFEWVGTVGYSGMVRLDGSLTKPHNKIIKLKNDGYKIVRKG